MEQIERPPWKENQKLISWAKKEEMGWQIENWKLKISIRNSIIEHWMMTRSHQGDWFHENGRNEINGDERRHDDVKGSQRDQINLLSLNKNWSNWVRYS